MENQSLVKKLEDFLLKLSINGPTPEPADVALSDETPVETKLESHEINGTVINFAPALEVGAQASIEGGGSVPDGVLTLADGRIIEIKDSVVQKIEEPQAEEATPAVDETAQKLSELEAKVELLISKINLSEQKIVELTSHNIELAKQLEVVSAQPLNPPVQEANNKLYTNQNFINLFKK